MIVIYVFKVEIEQNEELPKELYKDAVDDVVANTYKIPTFRMRRRHIVAALLFHQFTTLLIDD